MLPPKAVCMVTPYSYISEMHYFMSLIACMHGTLFAYIYIYIYIRIYVVRPNKVKNISGPPAWSIFCQTDRQTDRHPQRDITVRNTYYTYTHNNVIIKMHKN